MKYTGFKYATCCFEVEATPKAAKFGLNNSFNTPYSYYTVISVLLNINYAIT